MCRPLLGPTSVVVNDLFSAGGDVPFHVTVQGAVASVRAVTARSQLLADLKAP